MGRVKGKVAIVTGGGKNIGHSISVLLAKEGANVCIFDIDVEAGTRTANFIKKQGGECTFVECDVTKVEDIGVAVDKVIEKYGRVDILVNNVGNSKGITLEDIDEKTFQANIDNNLKSAFFCTKAVLPVMKKQQCGSIIFISSVNALLGGFGEVAYAFAKNAIHSLVKTLTADYSKYGMRFNVVCPGSIPKNSKTWKRREKEESMVMEKLSKLYPAGRFGEPMDIAYAVLFLASDEAKWITGVILPVDGGISATGNLPGGRWWENI